ncbi:MAG: HAD hydrolase family protein [Acidobacteria bacterium]|nr:HAD hydrolase family protein [Acidobacteriota bacterium]
MKYVGKEEQPDDPSGLAKRVKLLLMDCDGVLTDGRLYFSASGEELKVFHVRDGQGIASWHALGLESGIITGRGAGTILRARADELGMRYLKTESKDKVGHLLEILDEAGVRAEETAFIGDDLGDIGILNAVGFPVAVADAAAELDSHVLFKTNRPGGKGAVREVIDFLIDIKRNRS